MKKLRKISLRDAFVSLISCYINDIYNDIYETKIEYHVNNMEFNNFSHFFIKKMEECQKSV